jgi:hypothetical protein
MGAGSITYRLDRLYGALRTAGARERDLESVVVAITVAKKLYTQWIEADRNTWVRVELSDESMRLAILRDAMHLTIAAEEAEELVHARQPMSSLSLPAAWQDTKQLLCDYLKAMDNDDIVEVAINFRVFCYLSLLFAAQHCLQEEQL